MYHEVSGLGGGRALQLEMAVPKLACRRSFSPNTGACICFVLLAHAGAHTSPPAPFTWGLG